MGIGANASEGESGSTSSKQRHIAQAQKVRTEVKPPRFSALRARAQVVMQSLSRVARHEKEAHDLWTTLPATSFNPIRVRQRRVLWQMNTSLGV